MKAHELDNLLSLRARVAELMGAMAADAERLRNAERLVWGEKTWGCDAPEMMADEILELRSDNETLREAWDRARRCLAEADRENVALRARVVELEAKLEAAEQHVTICQRANTEEVERRRRAEAALSRVSEALDDVELLGLHFDDEDCPLCRVRVALVRAIREYEKP